MKARVLLLPDVPISEHPEMVCLRLVTANRGEEYDYLETMLLPEEARRLALALLTDSERALVVTSSHQFRERSLPPTSEG